MSLMNLWSTVNGIATLAFGGNSFKRQVILSQGKEKFTLPVSPAKYEVQTAQNNKTVDIIDFGEAMLFGNPQLLRLKFSCFFPRLYHGYTSFIVGDNKDATECVEQIVKWKESKKPVRVIITDSPINHMMGIKDFDYDERDGSHDINYTLSFIEYKDLNTPPSNNEKEVNEDTGLKERPETDAPPVSTDKLKKHRDILEMSKRAYNDVEYWRQIAEQNDLTSLALTNLNKLNIGK